MNYLDKLKHLNQRPDTGSTIQAGDRITWGADGTLRGQATVDFVQTDPDGSRWVFCSVADGWVAVNANIVTMSEAGGQN
jgi:hypothetical protein